MRVFAKVICFVLFFGSCSNDKNIEEQKNKVSQPKYKTELNWMGHWKAREGKEQLVRQLGREFEFLNQDVKVNIQFPVDIYKSGNGQLADSVVKMLQTNIYTWDIAFFDVYTYYMVGKRLNDPEWGKKYLVNFEEYDWFKENHKPFIFKDPQYRNATGGQIIGPVIEGIYVGLWYNKKVADKLGLSIKSTDMTIEDLKEYFKVCDEYNKTTNQKITLLYEEFMPNVKELLSSFILSALGPYDTTNVDINKGKAALLKGLQALEELAVYRPLTVLHDAKGKQGCFLEEKGLFTVIQTYVYNRLASIDKEKAKDLIPVEMPYLEKPPVCYSGTYQSVWGVFKNSPKKDIAIKAIQYVCTNDVAQKWQQMTKNPTGLKSRINSADLVNDPVDRWITGIEKKYGKNIATLNLSQVLFGRKNSFITFSGEPVLKGEKSAEEYFNSIVKQIKY